MKLKKTREPGKPFANPKWELFCIGVAKGLTNFQAYTSAGFDAEGKGAYVNASKLSRKPEIRLRIDELRLKRTVVAERTELITVYETLHELVRIGRADVKDAFDADGELLDIPNMPEDIRRAIAGFDVEQTVINPGAKEGESIVARRVKKVKFWNKNDALDKIAKHLGMFIDRKVVEHVGGQLTEAEIERRIDILAQRLREHDPLGHEAGAGRFDGRTIEATATDQTVSALPGRRTPSP